MMNIIDTNKRKSFNLYGNKIKDYITVATLNIKLGFDNDARAINMIEKMRNIQSKNRLSHKYEEWDTQFMVIACSGYDGEEAREIALKIFEDFLLFCSEDKDVYSRNFLISLFQILKNNSGLSPEENMIVVNNKIDAYNLERKYDEQVKNVFAGFIMGFTSCVFCCMYLMLL